MVEQTWMCSDWRPEGGIASFLWALGEVGSPRSRAPPVRHSQASAVPARPLGRVEPRKRNWRCVLLAMCVQTCGHVCACVLLENSAQQTSRIAFQKAFKDSGASVGGEAYGTCFPSVLIVLLAK